MTHPFLRSSLVALALGGVALPALAQVAGETRADVDRQLDREFALQDTNHDGVVTLPEVEARMAHLRANGQAVSPQESKVLARLWFSRADANGDGKVTRAEAKAVMDRLFDRYDANHDGRISPAEQKAARDAVRQRMASPR